jgi:hypothetical protein
VPFRIRWRKTRAWFVHLLHLDESAHRIALGVALGLLVGLTPTVGLQMLLVFLITSVIPANRAAGLPMVWITNPATIVPIYSFNYLVGHVVLGRSGQPAPAFRAEAAAVLAENPTWWDQVAAWWDLLMKAALELWIGSLIVGIVAAVVGYAVMYYLVTTYRRIHRRRLEARAAAEATGADVGPTPDPTEEPDGP